MQKRRHVYGINNTRTDWFFCKSGVKQGDNCSLTLFSIFVDDLVKELNNLGLGVSVGDTRVSALLYADDIYSVNKFNGTRHATSPGYIT